MKPEEQQGEPVRFVQIEGDVNPSLVSTTVSTEPAPPPPESVQKVDAAYDNARRALAETATQEGEHGEVQGG